MEKKEAESENTFGSDPDPYLFRVLDLRLEGRKQEVRVEEVEEQYNELTR